MTNMNLANISYHYDFHIILSIHVPVCNQMGQFKLIFDGSTVYCSDERLAQVKFINLNKKIHTGN